MTISEFINNETFLACISNNGLMNVSVIKFDIKDHNGRVVELFKVLPKYLKDYVNTKSESKKELKWAVQKLYVPTLSTIKEETF